jgi:hypothetical protein
MLFEVIAANAVFWHEEEYEDGLIAAGFQREGGTAAGGR